MSTSPIAQHVPQVTLGWRLRMAMEHGDVTRQQIADALGVSTATITRWTHDEGAGPRRAELREWAELCNVPLPWLETGELPGPGPKHPQSASTDDSLRKLTEAKRSRSRRGKVGPSTAGYLGLDHTQAA